MSVATTHGLEGVIVNKTEQEFICLIDDIGLPTDFMNQKP
jgi:hypothetical protein